jgi:hypothetical protein
MEKVFNGPVPNQRRPGQTFLGLQVSAELFKLVNEARKRLRMDRSRFVREAIAEKLRALGYDVPPSLIDPPDRADRGEAQPVSGKTHASPKPAPGPVEKRLADEGYDVERQVVGGAVLKIVSDPPAQLRAAETPAASPVGPRKKATYRKPKKAVKR